MVQLSLLAEESQCTLSDELRACAAEAGLRTADAAWIDEAVRATSVRFRSWARSPLGTPERARVRAYFHAVLRRRILTGRDEAARTARRRLLAHSIEADLVAAGWDRERAECEARRILGEEAG